MQPRDTIHPNQGNATTPSVQAEVSPQVSELDEPTAPATNLLPESPEASANDSVGAHGQDAITWRASEYVDHEKAASWYVVLALIAVAVVAGAYLITKDVVSTGAISIGAILFGVVAARKPRTLDYVVSRAGIQIGQTLHHYEHFKTFSVVDDGAIHSILLLPLKRFMPPLSLYYPPDQEDSVVETLGMYVPYQDGGADGFDRLMSRIRF